MPISRLTVDGWNLSTPAKKVIVKLAELGEVELAEEFAEWAVGMNDSSQGENIVVSEDMKKLVANYTQQVPTEQGE